MRQDHTQCHTFVSKALHRVLATVLLLFLLSACSGQQMSSSRTPSRAFPTLAPTPVGETPIARGKGQPDIGLLRWTSPELHRGQLSAWDAGDASGAHIYLRDGSSQRELVSAREPIYVAEWWPQDNGLLVWHEWGYCSSCNADGVRLATLKLDGRLTDLANVDTQAGGYSWSPTGHHLVIGTGGDRFVIFGRPRVLICDFPDVTCSTLNAPIGQLDLTPAWSPDGKFITFARGLAPEQGFNIDVAVATWQDRLGLWIARADGTGQQLLDTPGGSYPTWSADGRSIYFVRAGRRWRHDLYTGHNIDTGQVVISHPGRGWVNYSGESNTP